MSIMMMLDDDGSISLCLNESRGILKNALCGCSLFCLDVQETSGPLQSPSQYTKTLQSVCELLPSTPVTEQALVRCSLGIIRTAFQYHVHHGSSSPIFQIVFLRPTKRHPRSYTTI